MGAAKLGRLLFLTPVMPSDRGNGLAMRVGFFLQAYARCFDIDLAVVPIGSMDRDVSPLVSDRVHRVGILAPSGTDAHFALVRAVKDAPTRLAAFRRYGRPSLAGVVGPARPALDAWTRDIRYAAVHVSRLYLAELAAPWLRSASGPRPLVLIDCDEDDAEAYRRLARQERLRQRDMAADWLDAEAAAFARLAARSLPQFDALFVASRSEARTLWAHARRGRVIPNVAPTVAAAAGRRRTRGATVLFVGTLGYSPNTDAILWFALRVWPQLRRAFPQAGRLLIVGRDPPARIAALGGRNGVIVTGAVEDVAPFYAAADLVVVPIRSGAGTRIKLIEAAALGVPVVSTTFGIQGTTFRHGTELLLADGGAAFLRACIALLADRARAARLASRARQRARRDYDAAVWRLRVERFVTSLLTETGDCPPGEPST